MGADSFLEENKTKCINLLHRLYHNRDFLFESLADQIDSIKEFQSENRYTPNVFVLKYSKHFIIRAVIWPSEGREGSKPEDIFFYDIPHDHNFSFYTLGYSGPGYQTIISEYDYHSTVGYPGEHVSLSPPSIHELNEGSVLFFEKSKHIHTQCTPSSLSITINVLENVPFPRADQYFFDLEKEILTGKADDTPCALITRAISCFAPPKKQELLVKVARSHPDRRLREEAIRSLVKLTSDHSYWHIAKNSGDNYLTHIAKSELTSA